MKKLSIILILLCVQISMAMPAGIRNYAPGAEIGSTVPDFELPDLSGAARKLNSVKGEKGTLLIFVSAVCPYSYDYNGRMEKLFQDYKAKGINVVGLNANSSESSSQMKSYASENNLNFLILKDDGNKLADQLDASVTPEAYLLNAKNQLVYHGRIDNSRNVSEVQSNDLRDAIEAMLAGKTIAKTTARAFGCTIKRAN